MFLLHCVDGVFGLTLFGTILTIFAISQFSAGAPLAGLISKGVYFAVVLAILATVVWFLILSADKRTLARDRLAGKAADNRI